MKTPRDSESVPATSCTRLLRALRGLQAPQRGRQRLAGGGQRGAAVGRQVVLHRPALAAQLRRLAVRGAQLVLRGLLGRTRGAARLLALAGARAGACASQEEVSTSGCYGAAGVSSVRGSTNSSAAATLHRMALSCELRRAG